MDVHFVPPFGIAWQNRRCGNVITESLCCQKGKHNNAVASLFLLDLAKDFTGPGEWVYGTAVSRHLEHLTATGYLTVRGAKTELYRLSPDQIDRTFHALKAFCR